MARLARKEVVMLPSLLYNEADNSEKLPIMIDKTKQLILPLLALDTNEDISLTVRQAYSTDGLTSIDKRIELELSYADKLIPSSRFNRQLVSYQANKNTPVHRWMKYKEGFSAKLVSLLIEDLGISEGQHLLDPFAGVGTSLLVASQRGITSTGVELLPPASLAWQAKSAYLSYSISELESIYQWVENTQPNPGSKSFPHIPITETAFPEEEENILMYYKEYFESKNIDSNYQSLLLMMLMSILEDISYTRKDGQYLRWDSRSIKAQERDAKRIANGKKPYKIFQKQTILGTKAALLQSLQIIIDDIKKLENSKSLKAQQNLIKGSALTVLPEMEAMQFDGVITSPPYCNRYDYTRTYALELAFLGLSHADVVRMRQNQLSCTVENRSKASELRLVYESLNRLSEYEALSLLLEEHEALGEINAALKKRLDNGDLNNLGVVQMVKGYFTELAFVLYELFRLCRSGASVAFVNDNVRYGGEIIPVDLLLLDIAKKIGFEPIGIYFLPQRKGNSSQQMGRFGREALRKSVIVWRKP